MLFEDLKKAVESNDNNSFSYFLFKMLLKADSYNWNKLSKLYPKETKMISIYRYKTPFKKFKEEDSKFSFNSEKAIDFEKIEELADVS